MGMYGHLVAVAGDADVLAAWSDDQLYALLTGPDAADIDKAWEIVFPLVGSIAGTGVMLVDDPLPIGVDFGYGPAMFVEPGLVRTIAAAMNGADEAMLEAHWATLDSPFTELERYDDECGREFVMDGYRKTAQVFVTAAASSQGVLFAIM